MPKTKENPISFSRGFVQSRDVARVLATIDELSEEGAARTWLMKWTRADGKWGRFVVPWSATSLWVLDEGGAHVYATGPEGKVAILTPKGSQEETIDSSAEGPPSRGPLRELRGIAGRLYACGMGRQVYRREARGWTRQDQGAVLPPGVVKMAGFNSIDGLDDNELWAVGFGGEIWRRLRGKWEQIPSPTNVMLHHVKVADAGKVFACGQKGVLLSGGAAGWQQVDHDATKDHLWDLEWYQGNLYVCSESDLYQLRDNDTLEPVDLKLGRDWTFGHLHQNDGIMWSFGTKHLAWTEDGRKWHDGFPH